MPTKSLRSVPSKLGFAGAPLIDLQFLTEFGQVGDLVFFGCDIEINRRYGFANAGAANFVRAKTCMAELTLSGTYDLGTIASSDPADALTEIGAIARIIARFGGLPVLIACDHTASLGGLLGSMSDHSEAPVYVYFDAHFDLGRNCASDDLLHNGGFVGEILRQKWARYAINVGGRSMATKLAYPATPGFFNISASSSKTAIIALFASLAGKTIYVSIDADVLDPIHAPNVSCPEPNGMNADDLLACCHWLGQNCKVVGADLTEVLPSSESRDSERLFMLCLLALKTPIPSVMALCQHPVAFAHDADLPSL